MGGTDCRPRQALCWVERPLCELHRVSRDILSKCLLRATGSQAGAHGGPHKGDTMASPILQVKGQGPREVKSLAGGSVGSQTRSQSQRPQPLLVLSILWAFCSEHAHAHTHTLTLTRSHSHAHTHTLTRTRSHSHAHTHSLTPDGLMAFHIHHDVHLCCCAGCEGGTGGAQAPS